MSYRLFLSRFRRTYVIQTSIPLHSGLMPRHDGLANFVEPRRFDESIGCKLFIGCLDLASNPLTGRPLSYTSLAGLQITVNSWLGVKLDYQSAKMKGGTAALLSFAVAICLAPFCKSYAGLLSSVWRLGIRLLLWISKINYPRSFVSVYFVNYVHVCRV